MSGHKRATITISEEEYRRLHRADIRRRFAEFGRKAKPAAPPAELTNSLREMEDRQHLLEQTLRDLGQDLDWIGADMMEDLLAQNARCYQGLAAVIEETNSDANASLDSLSQRLSEEMQRERAEYERQLQALGHRLEHYEQREQSREQAARQWLRQSAAFADFIQEHLDHERFMPGRLSGIMSSLNFAQDNLAQGFFESSLQTSQQAFLQLSELHFELEQRIVEWQTEYERTQSALTQFVAELEMNSSVNAIGMEGEELADQVRLGYWSNGHYEDLVNKSRRLLTLLREEQRSIPTEELRRTQAELLPVVREKFESILYEARLKALSSQLRMTIAEHAFQALETQGFRLQASGYANRDMRAGFTAHLESSDGSQVMIEVLPATDTKQELANELVVITNHPSLKTEQEARLQWQELCRALHQHDLQVSLPEVHAPPPLTIPSSVENNSRRNEPAIQAQRHHNV
jgi:hypothetical protein